MSVISLLTSLVDVAFPRSCVACGVSLSEEPGHICWDCWGEFQIVGPPFCSICGDPVNGRVETDYICHWCADRAPAFDLARSAARYRGALQQALHAFKYAGGTYLVRDFIPLLEACARTHINLGEVDAVGFVPLHHAKLRERTYNQSELLARGLARRLRKPMAARCVARIRATGTQTHLTAAQRRENVRGAFGAREHAWLEGRGILLVDDVMTTGATVAECARVLKDGGAARVFVITVARG